MYFEEKLKLLVQSRHSLIYIITNEEERIEYVINQLKSQRLA